MRTNKAKVPIQNGRISADTIQHAPAGTSLRRRYAEAILKAMLIPGLLLLDLYNRRSEMEQRFLITLFFLIFGVTFLLGGDAIRHQLRVETYFTALSFSGFLEDLWLILTFRTTSGGAHDPYNHVVSYIFGGVINLPQLYIPFVATVYGYFFAGSVVHVLRNMTLARLNYVLAAFVVLFLLIKGLDGVQTVRTWTGLWVLVYACLKYYETRRLRYLLLMFTPPLFHFGYWLMTIPAWIVLVAGSRPLIYTSLLMISSITTFLPVQPTMEIIAQTERGASSLQWYEVSEQQSMIVELETQIAQTNWYNAYRRAGLQRWAPLVLVLTLFASGLYSRGMNIYQKRIFSIGVLTLVFSNLTWFIYAVYNRSLTVAMVFILAGFLMSRLDPSTAKNFRGLPPYYQWGLHLSLLLWAPLILFSLSVTLDRLSVFAFLIPFIVLFDPELNMSFKELLNMILGRG